MTRSGPAARGGRGSLVDAWPGQRLVQHAILVAVIGIVLLVVNARLEPLMSTYLAMAAMYATAMFGMVILVGLSGQVSLGNGAIMAVGAYTFAVTSLHAHQVPILGLPWNAVWSMIAAALAGIIAGLVIGGLGARLRGPYLAGLTLGLAVVVPALANRFPELLGGEDGLVLTVPSPVGGYPAAGAASSGQAPLSALMSATPLPSGDVVALPSANAMESGMAVVSQDDIIASVDGSAAAMPSSMPSPMPSPMPSMSGGMEVWSQDDAISSAAAQAPSTMPTPTGTAATTVAEAVDPTAVGGVDLGIFSSIPAWQAGMAVVLACLAGFVALNLVRGRQGRRWVAVRDNPIAASLVGIPPGATKVSAFVVSAFFAALAGAAFAQILQYVGPLAFTLGLSLSLLVGVVLGGRSSLVGALIGGVLIVALPEVIGAATDGSGLTGQVLDNVPTLVYGLLVVLVVLIAPGGLVGLVRSAWNRMHRSG